MPAETPVTIPEADPTVALAEPELQVPPPELVSVVVPPIQTVGIPPFADGGLFTVTARVEKQPLLSV